MSGHGGGHDSHGGGGEFFSKPMTFLATNNVTQSNPLKAAENIGNNLVQGTIGTVTAYIADILKPLKTAVDNLVAIPEHGWKGIPRGVLGAVTNTGSAFANIFTGVSHSLDRAVTHGVNNSIVDLTSGTTDRVPGVGNFVSNISRLGAGIVNAPFRVASWLTKIGPNALIDWINKIGLVQAPTRHLGNHGHTATGHSETAHH